MAYSEPIDPELSQYPQQLTLPANLLATKRGRAALTPNQTLADIQSGGDAPSASKRPSPDPAPPTPPSSGSTTQKSRKARNERCQAPDFDRRVKSLHSQPNPSPPSAPGPPSIGPTPIPAPPQGRLATDERAVAPLPLRSALALPSTHVLTPTAQPPPTAHPPDLFTVVDAIGQLLPHADVAFLNSLNHVGAVVGTMAGGVTPALAAPLMIIARAERSTFVSALHGAQRLSASAGWSITGLVDPLDDAAQPQLYSSAQHESRPPLDGATSSLAWPAIGSGAEGPLVRMAPAKGQRGGTSRGGARASQARAAGSTASARGAPPSAALRTGAGGGPSGDPNGDGSDGEDDRGKKANDERGKPQEPKKKRSKKAKSSKSGDDTDADLSASATDQDADSSGDMSDAFDDSIRRQPIPDHLHPEYRVAAEDEPPSDAEMTGAHQSAAVDKGKGKAVEVSQPTVTPAAPVGRRAADSRQPATSSSKNDVVGDGAVTVPIAIVDNRLQTDTTPRLSDTPPILKPIEWSIHLCGKQPVRSHIYGPGGSRCSFVNEGEYYIRQDVDYIGKENEMRDLSILSFADINKGTVSRLIRANPRLITIAGVRAAIHFDTSPIEDARAAFESIVEGLQAAYRIPVPDMVASYRKDAKDASADESAQRTLIKISDDRRRAAIAKDPTVLPHNNGDIHISDAAKAQFYAWCPQLLAPLATHGEAASSVGTENGPVMDVDTTGTSASGDVGEGSSRASPAGIPG